jgi:hypothetical protein
LGIKPYKEGASSAAKARNGSGNCRHKTWKTAKPPHKALKKITVNILWQMIAIKVFTATVYHKALTHILFNVLWMASQHLVGKMGALNSRS